jgi:hypothetical protein
MTRQWLLDAKGVGYENPDWRPTRESLEYTAAVYEREADLRPGDPFQATLREWAAKYRRKAAALVTEPVQADLFDVRNW